MKPSLFLANARIKQKSETVLQNRWANRAAWSGIVLASTALSMVVGIVLSVFVLDLLNWFIAA